MAIIESPCRAAMRVIDRAKKEGKQVKSFVSWCGGLPELSASEVRTSVSRPAGANLRLGGQVPLGYKFSWSPKAVLTASMNGARYKLANEVSLLHNTLLPADELTAMQTYQIQGDQLLAQHFPSVALWDRLPLEGLANRDSLPYAEKYGLGLVEGLTNLFRGTLRCVLSYS